MQASEFPLIFAKYPQINSFFLGVYSIDNIPPRIPTRNFCICNTAPKKSSGEHWFCVFKNDHKQIEIFDSLGVNNIKIECLQKIFKRQTKSLVFNESVFQDQFSSSCGQYCVYFVFQRVHNFDLSFDEILEEAFDQNIDTNERTVDKFVQSVCKNV
jgi:hypothetical protein